MDVGSLFLFMHLVKFILAVYLPRVCNNVYFVNCPLTVGN